MNEYSDWSHELARTGPRDALVQFLGNLSCYKVNLGRNAMGKHHLNPTVSNLQFKGVFPYR